MKRAEKKRERFARTMLLGMGLLSLLLMAAIATVYAGAVLVYGQLSGNPVQANYLAWVGNQNLPLQVLTEDGFNTQDGPDQGYVQSSTQAGQYFFLLNADNFDNPAVVDNSVVNMLFGGEGEDSGTIWQTVVRYGSTTAFSNHGMVINTAVGSCPKMLPSSQSAAGTELTWAGNGTNEHHIYRSMNGSGAGNGASNGRYDYLATVAEGTESYLDPECVSGTACWHIIIPAHSEGVFAGCHSAESPLPEQELLLDAGWNMISTYVHPAYTDLADLMAPIEGEMTLLKNGSGEVFWPAYSVDQIGSWDTVEGYQLHMQSAQTFTIAGGRAKVSILSSMLGGGWNMAGYWRETPMAAETAWAILGDNLFLAKDGDGRVYWPDLEIDQIGDLQPGQGYQIYANADGSLHYPVSAPSAE